MTQLSKKTHVPVILGVVVGVGVTVSLLNFLIVRQCEIESRHTNPEQTGSKKVEFLPKSYGVLTTGLLLTCILGLFIRNIQPELESRKEQASIQELPQENQGENNLSSSFQAPISSSQTKELEAQEKSSFLSSIREQLRSPVHTILGYSTLIKQEQQLGETTKCYLDSIISSGKHLLQLVEGVAEFSQLEGGEVTLNQSAFDLNLFLDSVKNMLESKALAKGLRFIFYLPEDLPHTVITDESKLRRILTELLDNGIKYCQSGGVTLRIGVIDLSWLIENGIENSQNPSNPALLFEIEDTGEGIKSEVLANIFEPFVSLCPAEKTAPITGLGLPIVRKLVELMGGTITISSRVSQGTLVKIYLPVSIPVVEECPPISNSPRGAFGLASEQSEHLILGLETFEKSIADNFNPQSLKVMSSQWRMKVYQSASAGDSQEIRELIKDVPDIYPRLITYLNALVDNFDFRKLRELMQEIQSTK